MLMKGLQVPNSLNGVHLYSTFLLVFQPVPDKSVFTHLRVVAPIKKCQPVHHEHTLTPMEGKAIRSNLGVQYLGRGHFDI